MAPGNTGPFADSYFMHADRCVFDATRPVALQLRTPEGVKTIRVRFPSDDEWIDRQRRRKVIIKNLGRGVSETTMPGGEEVDAALLAKIRTEETPEVDAFEAAKLMEELSYCVVDDVVPVSDGYRINLRVPGATTVVLLKMPSQKDVTEYRRGFARLLELPFNRQQITLNLRVAGDLYRKLLVATEGYAGEPPIIHQSIAARAAIHALDTAFAEDAEANF